MKLTINGAEIEAARGETVLKAAGRAGVDIPHLCSRTGAEPRRLCRLCVVEVEGEPRLLTSCTLEAAEGMAVHTHTPRVLKARRAIMELLVADHRRNASVVCGRRTASSPRSPASWACAATATSACASSTRWTSAPRLCGATPTSACSAAAASRPATTCRAWAPSTSSAGVQDRVAPGFSVGLKPEPVCLLRPVRARVPHGRDRGARPGRRVVAALADPAPWSSRRSRRPCRRP